MKICIIAEGCYPYVVGGVSGWINNLICSFPRVSFSVLAIISDRSISKKFQYTLPENVTEVHEVYLNDCEWTGKGKSRKHCHLSAKEAAALKSLLLGKDTDWGNTDNTAAKPEVFFKCPADGTGFFRCRY